MMRVARVVGHAAWWVFVVAVLLAGGVTWWSSYSMVDASFWGSTGWTAYTPLRTTDEIGAGVRWSAGTEHWWQDVGVYALIAFVVVIVAGVIDAVAGRRIAPGLVTVLVPFISLGFFVLATPGTFDGFTFRAVLMMLIVLVGVAIREVWMRVFLPRFVDRSIAADG